MRGIFRPDIFFAGAVLLCFLWLMATGCGARQETAGFDEVCYAPRYAQRFEILGMQDSLSRVVRVKSVWQGADSSAFDLFIARGGEVPPEGFAGQVIQGEARRIVAMSSSYVAMIDLCGCVDRVVGVSGIGFISNSYIRNNWASVADVGNEANADFEKIVAVRPDLVLIYGVSGASPMERRLRSLGIPYLYVCEYLEPSPLGRAEWIVALAEICGCRERGEEVFREIEERYLRLKSLVSEADSAATLRTAERPKVMLNTPYGDNWFMTSRGSAMAALIEDAGAEYVYRDNSSDESRPVDLEKAFLLASEADFWLNTGQISSLGELASALPKFAGLPCVLAGNVYNCDRVRTEGGGNDFWESGPARPDLVLEDLIRIFHPELLDGGHWHYYRKVE